MGLTSRTGPLGPEPRGTFDFDPPPHAVYVEPLGRRVRAVKGGRTVVDSEDAKLLHETGRLPRYVFPAADVDASAVPARDEPLAPGHVRVPWREVDHWYEEDEEVFVHPRDPYTRVEILRTARRVQVSVGGHPLADTTRALALYETGLPPRWYVPRDDVDMALLSPSATLTRCPYKGSANHWTATLPDGTTVEDVAWSYDDDVRYEVEPIRGHLAFYPDRVTLDVG